MGFGNFSLSQPRKIPRKNIPRFQIGVVASQWLPEGIKTGNLLPNKAKTEENSPNCPWGSTFVIPMQGSHNSWKILGSTFPIQIQGSHNSWDGSVPVGSQISQKKPRDPGKLGASGSSHGNSSPGFRAQPQQEAGKIPGFGNLFGISSQFF